MAARTGAEYLAGLRDGREIWLHGERVPDVTTHPKLAGIARSVADLYDMQHDPALQDTLTYTSPSSGEPVGLVKLDPVESHASDGLREGERVLLWEPGLEAEGRLLYDVASGTWLAEPDGATWRDAPLDEGHMTGDAKPGHAS